MQPQQKQDKAADKDKPKRDFFEKNEKPVQSADIDLDFEKSSGQKKQKVMKPQMPNIQQIKEESDSEENDDVENEEEEKKDEQEVKSPDKPVKNHIKEDQNMS